MSKACIIVWCLFNIFQSCIYLYACVSAVFTAKIEI